LEFDIFSINFKILKRKLDVIELSIFQKQDRCEEYQPKADKEKEYFAGRREFYY